MSDLIKPFLQILAMQLINCACFAQTDTVFFNSTGQQKMETDDVTHFCVLKPANNSWYDGQAYDYKTSKLSMKIHTRIKDSIYYDADITRYYESGFRQQEQIFRNGKPVGKWAGYYDSSATMVYYRLCR